MAADRVDDGGPRIPGKITHSVREQGVKQ